jgi:hypothetical protein
MHRRHRIDICVCGVKSSTWNHDYTGAASIMNWNAVFWSPLHYGKIFRTIEERLVVCRTYHAPDSSHGCQSSRILPASVWVFQGFTTLFWTWTRAILEDYFFFLSVAFRLKGWKTSPETNTAVDWSLEKCLPCLWVDDDGKNLQYILSFKLIVFWHHECSVFFLIFLIINWITDIYSRKRKFTRAKDNSKPPLFPLPTFSFSSLILNHHISCTIVEA